MDSFLRSGKPDDSSRHKIFPNIQKKMFSLQLQPAPQGVVIKQQESKQCNGKRESFSSFH